MNNAGIDTNSLSNYVYGNSDMPYLAHEIISWNIWSNALICGISVLFFISAILFIIKSIIKMSDYRQPDTWFLVFVFSCFVTIASGMMFCVYINPLIKSIAAPRLVIADYLYKR